MTNNYDIFISYRRDNGEDKARILNQFLSTVGYRVFFDHESGMTGEFETEILAAVEIAPVFLMLLTPHCLDRCKDEGDWVRREIERASKIEKTWRNSPILCYLLLTMKIKLMTSQDVTS